MSKFMPEEDMNIPDELHLASMIVLARPEDMEAVKLEFSSIDNLEIFADDPIGKIIIVIEATDTRSLRNITSRVETAKGVMSASLVYHETIDATEADLPVIIDQTPQETLSKIQNA